MTHDRVRANNVCKDCLKKADRLVEYQVGGPGNRSQVALHFCSACLKPAMKFIMGNIPVKKVRVDGNPYLQPNQRTTRQDRKNHPSDSDTRPRGNRRGPKAHDELARLHQEDTQGPGPSGGDTDPFSAKPAHLAYME